IYYKHIILKIINKPTKYLNNNSREVLKNIFLHFKATILFVSHDRYFIQKIANKILLIENCKGKLYPMPYEDYLEERQKEIMKPPIKNDSKLPKKVKTKTIKKPINEYKLRKVEEKIDLLEEKLN